MKKILVMMVDDNERFLRQHAAGLEDFGDLSVITANGSDEAIRKLEQLKSKNEQLPDIFLLDIIMPGVLGGELAGLIRQEPKLNSKPIVFFTASDQIVTRDEVERAGGRFGGEEILTKGKFGLDELRVFILNRLGKGPQ